MWGFVYFLFAAQLVFAANERYEVEVPVTLRTFLPGNDYLTVVGDLPVGSVISFDESQTVDPQRYQNSSGNIATSRSGWYRGVSVEDHPGRQDPTDWNQYELYMSTTHLSDVAREGATPPGNVRIPLTRLPSTDQLGRKHRLWGTFYHTPLYNVGGQHVLNDLNDQDLLHGHEPAALSHEQYCNSAMQGSVRIVFNSGDSKTFNYAGVKDPALIDCSRYYGNRYRATAKVRFREANSLWGDGVLDYSLIPYRSIAVNPNRIPYGTVLYIPKAKGVVINVEGKRFVHDGYFFASDTGGAMRADASHIDFFVGNKNRQTFPFITSSPKGKFDAFVVDDESIIDQLGRIHLKKY